MRSTTGIARSSTSTVRKRSCRYLSTDLLIDPVGSGCRRGAVSHLGAAVLAAVCRPMPRSAVPRAQPIDLPRSGSPGSRNEQVVRSSRIVGSIYVFGMIGDSGRCLRRRSRQSSHGSHWLCSYSWSRRPCQVRTGRVELDGHEPRRLSARRDEPGDEEAVLAR
jgi:hypothetical protein